LLSPAFSFFGSTLYRRLLKFKVVQIFEAIAQPKRREILKLLAVRELSAGEIGARFPVSQPAISQHLKVLRDAGLVSERRDGTRRLYSLRSEGLADLHRFLADVMPIALGRLKEAAEEEQRSAGGAASGN
jgi:DNA-binding transcriptional ArsR family regulator